MKFGQIILKKLVPEWENYYFSYKQLKLILRSFKYAKLYLFKEHYLKKKGKLALN